MSYPPASLTEARRYLITRGVPANAVGIVGDGGHDHGYHLGWDRISDLLGWDDYSVSESPRDANPTDAAMALDIGTFPQLRELSNWLVAQCRAGAPDTQDIREVIYSPDGQVVRRWDRLGLQSGGDDSHLWHTHISYFRDSESRDKTALFRRFFESAPVDLEDDMPTAIGPVELPSGVDAYRSYSIPPVNSGALPWGPAWMSIWGDLWDGRAAFRVAIANLAGDWTIVKGPDGAQRIVVESGVVWNYALPAGARGISVKRLAVDDGDDASGSVSMSVEYGRR